MLIELHIMVVLWYSAIKYQGFQLYSNEHSHLLKIEISLSFLSARTAMWSMPVVLTETENENDYANKKWRCKVTSQALATLFADGIISD